MSISVATRFHRFVCGFVCGVRLFCGLQSKVLGMSVLCNRQVRKGGPSRDQCGATAGHTSSWWSCKKLEQAADLLFRWWGGEDLNLRPTDYESVPGRGAGLRECAEGLVSRGFDCSLVLVVARRFAVAHGTR